MSTPPPGYGYPQGQTPPPQPTGGNHIMLDRFLARLIDGAVLFIPYLILSAIARALFSSNFLALFVSGILLLALYIGYEVFFLGTQGGQTIGKKVLKLRVIKEDGSPLDVAAALPRAAVLFGGNALSILGGVTAFFSFLGGLIVLGVALSPFADSATGRYQGLHDKFAKSLVVKSA